jgi:hypothetical protein
MRLASLAFGLPSSERVMSDIFREVDEDLRRYKMMRLFKRYGGLAVGVALVIVVATAGWVAWSNWRQTQREADTAQLVAALDSAATAPAKSADALAGFAGKAPPDLAALGRLSEAALRSHDGNGEAAIAIYDALAAGTGVPPIYRDLATLLSVMRQSANGDAAALQARLAPLTVETNPWRHSARELTAVLAARAGDKDRARTILQQLADDVQAPAGVRSRAADLAALYGRT